MAEIGGNKINISNNITNSVDIKSLNSNNPDPSANYTYDPDTTRLERVHSLLREYPSSLTVQPLNSYLLSLHAIIRDSNTKQEQFVKNSDILLKLLCEFALEELTYKSIPITIKPATESSEAIEFNGITLENNRICAVSILRAGESMESAIMSCIQDVKIGKILVQRDETTSNVQAKLFYTKLPEQIKNCTVLLMDPMLATGSSSKLAIATLIQYGVKEENIYFITLMSCPEGIRAVLKQYPNIHLITGMIDEKLNSQCYLLPGVGDFGDRYFGTTTL